MPVVLDRFLETLRQSGLMSEEEIADFLAGLGEDEKPATGDDLAPLLHRHRKLTRSQIQSVYQGKTKGLVLGSCVVLEKIRQGGMGHVYQAQHRRMKRIVTLKVLPSAVAESEKAVERFQHTVRMAGDGTREQFEKMHEVVARTRPNYCNISNPIELTSELIVQ